MVLVIITGLFYSLIVSPPDYIQGDSVRIMYVHVPSSFIALGCFGFIGVASICNLIFKIKLNPKAIKAPNKSLSKFLFLSNKNKESATDNNIIEMADKLTYMLAYYKFINAC